jgi:hypothetical protein
MFGQGYARYLHLDQIGRGKGLFCEEEVMGNGALAALLFIDGVSGSRCWSESSM